MIKVGENRFKKYAWAAMSIILLCSIVLAVQLKNLSFDYNFEKFYPTNDEDTKFFMDLRERFSSDNDFLLLAIPNEGGVFEKQFLDKLSRFTEKLEKVDDVEFVLSITNQSEHFIFPGGSSKSVPYIDLNNFDRNKDSARVYKNVELVNTMVSRKGNAAGIYLRHTDFISKKRSDALIVNIQKLGNDIGFDRVVLSGRTVGQKYYIDVMSFEMLLFLGLSAVLVVIFLFIAFRSVWGILIPQVVILIGMLWLIGGMGLFKEPINIILTVLPSVMFVVSISDSIHLVSRYLDALRSEDTPFKAMLLAINEVGLATLLTSVTTAVGFFTLYFVRVQPIQVFGIVMGIGVLMAFVLTFVMLPILFYWFPGPKFVREKEKDHFWKKYLDKSFKWTIRHPKLILLIGVLVVAVSILGAMKIKTNNYLMDDINPKEQLKVDFNYMDAEFGGVRPFVMSVSLTDTSSSLWNLSTLKEVDTVQQYLETEFGVQIRSSLVNVLKVMHRGSYSGQPDYYKLPKSRKLRSFRRNIRIADQGKLIGTLMDSTESELLISGVMPDVGSIEFKKRKEKFEKYLKSRSNNAPVAYKMTGSAYLIDKNMGYLSESMVKGLALSILIVALIMGMIYRSVSVLLISLVPNLFPLIFIAGVMGYLGVELKTSTAIIFTIAFGIAVDDTIHFMGKFKHELLKGKGKLYALKRSYMTTGKAMILTTLILCSGFLLLVLSSFMGTFYMGVMLCITLFVALIADLTILPALMMLFYKERNPKK